MTRKTIIIISLIVAIALLGGGALFFTGALNFSAVLAPASPTATIVALPSTVETTAPDTPPPLPTATPIPPPSSTPVEPAAPARSSPTATLPAVQSSRPVQPAAANRAVEASPVEAEGLTGQWDFNFGVMTLKQNGTGVSGTYRWYGGQAEGQIKGTIVHESDQFSGLWISQNNPNEQGFLKWRIIDNRATTGTFENNGLKGQWCGVRSGKPLPAGCGFSGAWNLHIGSGNVGGRAQLVQTGDQVTGVYTTEAGDEGQIVEASIVILSMTEATLQGTWREANGEAGQFEWRLDQTTNQTFAGRNLEGNSEWCGWREGADRPIPCGF